MDLINVLIRMRSSDSGCAQSIVFHIYILLLRCCGNSATPAFKKMVNCEQTLFDLVGSFFMPTQSPSSGPRQRRPKMPVLPKWSTLRTDSRAYLPPRQTGIQTGSVLRHRRRRRHRHHWHRAPPAPQAALVPVSTTYGVALL